MDLGDAVAVRLTWLTRTPTGELSANPLAAEAVRGGLLVDLTLAGRIVDTADGAQLDTEPTGFPPADLLLDAVLAAPDKTLEWWLRRGWVGRPQIVEHLLEAGYWTETSHGHLHRHATYTDTGRHQPPVTAADTARLRQLASTDDDPELDHAVDLTDPVDAATACLAAAAGLLERTPAAPPQRLIDRCGTASWMVLEVLGYLAASRADRAAAAADARASLSINFIQ